MFASPVAENSNRIKGFGRPGLILPNMDYDLDGTQVWYKSFSNWSLANALIAAHDVNPISASAVQNLNTVQASVGYTNYEHPLIFWFNFPTPRTIRSISVYYTYANNRAGNLSAMRVQASSNSPDGVSGNFFEGSYSEGVPLRLGTIESNVRHLTFDIFNCNWVRVGFTGISWSSSPKIHTIWFNYLAKSVGNSLSFSRR